MEGSHKDDFGTVWQGARLGLYGIPVEWPIKDLNRLDDYQWPEVFSAGPPRRQLYRGNMIGSDESSYVRGAWIVCFQQVQQLRGIEDFFADLATESREFYHLRDMPLDFNLRWIDKWIKLDCDGYEFADDWGHQRGLMMNPKTWRRIFKPRWAEMLRKVRAAGKDVWFHTDDHTNEVWVDLVEIGANVINCQVKVVGRDWLAASLRGKVAFRTGVDCQGVLPFGSPSEVKEEVHRIFEACGTSEGDVVA